VQDVAYLMEQVWRGKSAVSRTTEHLTLVRWDPARPTTLWNVVPLTGTEAAHHERLARPADGYAPDVVARIQARLDAEERLQTVMRDRGWL
jgi:tRNA threonylcarbamoyladenosine dehydratase